MKNNISENSKINKCSGCGVCASICPTKAIGINLDDKGFYISNVDENKCIDCGICKKVCCFNEKIDFKKPIKTFSCTRKENSEKTKSSSSGIAWDIAKIALEKDYLACGAKYNYKKNNVEHFIAETVKEYIPAQGSKYLQSYTVDTFSQIINNKSKDKYIVFGTPCQIASLKNYIKMRKIEDRFILIDFFCHGVPSYHLWESYLEYHKINKIEEIIFRDNSKELWNDYCMNIKTKDKTLISSSKNNDLFYRFFLLDFCLNKTCSESCMFFSTNSCADIRVGDIWNRKIHSNKKPMSLSLVYNEKINWILEELNDTQEFKDEEVTELIKGEPMGFRKYFKLTDKVIILLRKRVNLKILFYIFVCPKLIIGVIKRKINCVRLKK